MSFELNYAITDKFVQNQSWTNALEANRDKNLRDESKHRNVTVSEPISYAISPESLWTRFLHIVRGNRRNIIENKGKQLQLGL